MSLLGDIAKSGLIVGWVLVLFALFRACYCGLRMGADLKDGVNGPPTSIPLLVEDDEILTDEGIHYRDQFYLWLGLFIFCSFCLMVGMYFYHLYWP